MFVFHFSFEFQQVTAKTVGVVLNVIVDISCFARFISQIMYPFTFDFNFVADNTWLFLDLQVLYFMFVLVVLSQDEHFHW